MECLSAVRSSPTARGQRRARGSSAGSGISNLAARLAQLRDLSAAHFLHGASTLLNCSVLVGARLLEHLCAAAHMGERRDARQSSTRDDRAGMQIEIQRRASRCRWSSDAIHDDASSFRCEFAALRCLSSIISRARRRVSCTARPRRESARGDRQGGEPCMGHGARAPRRRGYSCDAPRCAWPPSPPQ